MTLSVRTGVCRAGDSYCSKYLIRKFGAGEERNEYDLRLPNTEGEIDRRG